MLKVNLMIAGLAVALMPTVATAQNRVDTNIEFKENVNYTEFARGTYEYIKGDSGKFRGEDDFTLTVNKDGSRTMRMFTLVQETGLMRDITHRVDANFRPIETFTLTYKDGVRTGTGLFVFEGDRAKGLVLANNGILTQDVDVSGFFAAVPHSMAADGWYFSQYDYAKGGVQRVKLFNPHGWGNNNGSVLAKIQSAPIRFVGKERITVPAGTFETERWEIVNGGANNDDKYEVWVHGPDRIMVKLIDHPRDWVYNLKTFETSRNKKK